jgi:hypothetical protein
MGGDQRSLLERERERQREYVLVACTRARRTQLIKNGNTSKNQFREQLLASRAHFIFIRVNSPKTQLILIQGKSGFKDVTYVLLLGKSSSMSSLALSAAAAAAAAAAACCCLLLLPAPPSTFQYHSRPLFATVLPITCCVSLATQSTYGYPPPRPAAPSPSAVATAT